MDFREGIVNAIRTQHEDFPTKHWNIQSQKNMKEFHKIKNEMYKLCCTHGNLIVAKWIERQVNIDFVKNLFRFFKEAERNKHFGFCEYLYTKFPEKCDICIVDAFKYACHRRNSKIMEYVIKKMPTTGSHTTRCIDIYRWHVFASIPHNIVKMFVEKMRDLMGELVNASLDEYDFEICDKHDDYLKIMYLVEQNFLNLAQIDMNNLRIIVRSKNIELIDLLCGTYGHHNGCFEAAIDSFSLEIVLHIHSKYQIDLHKINFSYICCSDILHWVKTVHPLSDEIINKIIMFMFRIFRYGEETSNSGNQKMLEYVISTCQKTQIMNSLNKTLEKIVKKDFRISNSFEKCMNMLSVAYPGEIDYFIENYILHSYKILVDGEVKKYVNKSFITVHIMCKSGKIAEAMDLLKIQKTDEPISAECLICHTDELPILKLACGHAFCPVTLISWMCEHPSSGCCYCTLPIVWENAKFFHKKIDE
ncbi:MAG: hypothetical protein Satyrvirus27_17 [Satyrvirus sp.]|uniref:RING-type domain-containing protein n=1 Tax=Satyrvirus sp. TaxID=2487771 RepID=A0A3G5AEM8_9VIRU|nr:MAG: hypothetical protein Satyrvirus27_17 [Satyrvirus sp.]